MRFLFLSQGKTVDDHVGYHQAFLRLSKEGVLDRYDNLPYRGYAADHGWNRLFEEVYTQCAENRYDAVLFQNYHHSSNADPTVCIARLRSLSEPPYILVSNGDPWSCGIWDRQLPSSFLACARAADVTFSSSMGMFADFLIRKGVRNVMLMPHALCDARFKAAPREPAGGACEYDVVMVGYMGRRTRVFGRADRFFSPWTFSLYQRLQTARALQKRYGKRFGLFGKNWTGFSSWQGEVPFAEQQSVFMRSRLVVDAWPPVQYDYYASDRPFFVIGAGVPLVMFPTPRVDRLLRNEEHVFFTGIPEAAPSVCDRVLDMDAHLLQEKMRRSSEWVRAQHTVGQRVRLMVEVARLLSDRKTQRTRVSERIPLPYLLPEVDQAQERVHALKGWLE